LSRVAARFSTFSSADHRSGRCCWAAGSKQARCWFWRKESSFIASSSSSSSTVVSWLDRSFFLFSFLVCGFSCVEVLGRKGKEVIWFDVSSSTMRRMRGAAGHSICRIETETETGREDHCSGRRCYLCNLCVCVCVCFFCPFSLFC
jgi:hypothetical protein